MKTKQKLGSITKIFSGVFNFLKFKIVLLEITFYPLDFNIKYQCHFLGKQV